MKLKLISLFTLYFISISFSQSNDEKVMTYVAVRNYEIDNSSIQKIESPNITEFQGSYHFGESEGESDLDVLYSNGKLFAKTVYSIWENNGWTSKSDRLPVSYLNNSIKIDSTVYELYKCVNDDTYTLGKGERGLVSHYYEENNGVNYHYIQFNSDAPKPNMYVGEYPEASFIKLTKEDLKGLRAYYLKTMRNEIFARHGYKFKTGGPMYYYFEAQDWYKNLKKVEHVNLSAIEKYNIELILELEKEQE